MNTHVETILQAAALEKQEFSLNKKQVHGNELLLKSVGNYELVLKEKDGHIVQNFNAKTDVILADEQHFTNMLNNLLDNAIKYSNEAPHITLTTHSTARHFIIRIEDKGIGMSRESVKRIFEKFFRAHTGNIHNVKGFGLGMSYVKWVMDIHKGTIKVDSAIDKGTTITLILPMQA
jgi:two-component system phosphate regulon sensor histidine kinase PhoR